jgi:hypothetical protein
VTTIVNDYLLSFFEETLNGETSQLFDGSNRYPEVKSLK